jgi:hypothetical protein
MTEETWTPERVRKEIYDARTKLFVVAQVLQTGAVKVAEDPEWALVLEPLLTDIVENTGKIRSNIRAAMDSSGDAGT